MSFTELRLAWRASPWRARSLLTVRAAISSATSSERPRSSRPSLMCSYWRSRLALQACCGIVASSSSDPRWATRAGELADRRRARASYDPYDPYDPCETTREPTMIDPDAAFLHGVAHRLALSLATLVVDQALTSESDVPFEPFTARFEVGTRVTAATFKQALGFDAGRKVDLGPAAPFFENAAAGTDDPRTRQVFAVLEHVMRRSLTGLSQAYARGEGIVEV